MKYHFNSDNHTLTCVMVPVNGFGSASFMEISTHVAVASCSGRWDGVGASCCYSAGIIDVPYCIIAVYCIHTILGDIFF